MKEYSKACHGHPDFDRCRLNHYNSGVHYAKSGFHGAYWLRVQCFEKAAELESASVRAAGECSDAATSRARSSVDCPASDRK